MASTKIIQRVARRVEVGKTRFCLSAEALDALKISEDDNEVIVTVYEDKVVITKKKRGLKNENL